MADLEYQIAQANLEAAQTRVNAGTATWHDAEDAREQAKQRYNSLQDANFDLERAASPCCAPPAIWRSWVNQLATERLDD